MVWFWQNDWWINEFYLDSMEFRFHNYIERGAIINKVTTFAKLNNSRVDPVSNNRRRIHNRYKARHNRQLFRVVWEAIATTDSWPLTVGSGARWLIVANSTRFQRTVLTVFVSPVTILYITMPPLPTSYGAASVVTDSQRTLTTIQFALVGAQRATGMFVIVALSTLA